MFVGLGTNFSVCLVVWVLCFLVSIFSLVFCFMWPMVEQGLSSQVRAGNLTDGMAFVPAGSVCPCLGEGRELGDSVEGDYENE